MTRLRSEQPGDIPGDLMATHYGQRASDWWSAHSERRHLCPYWVGVSGAPGIYDDAQIAGWKKVTNAVHAKGGKIFLQICTLAARAMSR